MKARNRKKVSTVNQYEMATMCSTKTRMNKYIAPSELWIISFLLVQKRNKKRHHGDHPEGGSVAQGSPTWPSAFGIALTVDLQPHCKAIRPHRKNNVQ
jgi:hypothetical protein